MNADEVIKKMNLEPLEKEGGYFRRTYCSVQNAVYNGKDCPIVSAIYFLITPEDFSALHILERDEIFHFYAGDSIDFLQITEDGTQKTVTFGNNIRAGDHPQIVVPGKVWQGLRISANSESKNGWALVGTTVSPAFVYEDFRVASREELEALFPHLKSLITKYTRASAEVKS